MFTGCGDPDDISGDPTRFILVPKVFINALLLQVTVRWQNDADIPANCKFYVYFDGVIIDRDAKSGNVYPLTWSPVTRLSSVVIYPVPPSVEVENYDPLCGNEDLARSTDVASRVEYYTDFIYPNRNFVDHNRVTPLQHFVCRAKDSHHEHHAIEHPNFVPAELNQIGSTVKVGSLVRLKPRWRVNGRHHLLKDQGPTREVIEVMDYRFVDFDEARYRIQTGLRTRCSPIPAQKTTIYVRIAEGVFAMDELEVVKS